MVTKRTRYSNWTKVKGVLREMDVNLRREIIELCRKKASEDLEPLGRSEEELLWRYEQKYIGTVNGHKVTSSKPFEGAEPYTFIYWKLVN